MATHLALLRGINLGGRNRVVMQALREAFEALGHGQVVTYIQSGNVLFDAADMRTSTTALAEALESALVEQLGVRAPVVVLTRVELHDVLRANPFAAEPDGRAVHAVFAPRPVDEAGSAAVARAVVRAQAKGSPDDARVAGRALYVWTPGGFGRSVLVTELGRAGAESTPLRTGTARNWATVTELARLSGMPLRPGQATGAS